MKGERPSRALHEQSAVGANTGDDTQAGRRTRPAARKVAGGVQFELLWSKLPAHLNRRAERRHDGSKNGNARRIRQQPRTAHLRRAQVYADTDGKPVETRPMPAGFDENAGELLIADEEIVRPLEANRRRREGVERRRKREGKP